MVTRFEAVKTLIVNEGRVLLLWDPNYPYKDKWEPPGGRKRENESDANALIRETKEEAGIEIKITKLINQWEVQLPKRDMLISGKTYLCEAVTKNVSLNDEEKQHTEFRWIPIQEAEQMDLVPWLKEALKKIK